VAVITSQATGVWSAGATWAGGVPPAAGVDSYVIANTHVVTVDAEYVGAGFLGGTVNVGGELVFSNAANARLHHSGDNSLTVNGTLTGDFSAVPALLCQITFAPTTDGGAGLILNGIVNLRGAPKDHMRLLAADCGEWAASGDVATAGNVPQLTLDAIPSGWRDHDIIVRAPTGRIYSHWDTCRLNGAPAAAVIDVEGWQGAAPTYDAGVGTKPLWNAQGAGLPAQARAACLNLTRNVRIYSTDPTKRTYISIGTVPTVTMNYVEAYSIGFNGAGKYGVDIHITTGACNLTGMVVHNSNSYGYRIWGLEVPGTVALTDCTAWTITTYPVSVSPFAGSATLNTVVAGASAAYGFSIGDVGSTFPNCRAIGNASYGGFVSEAAAIMDGFMDGFVSHSNGSRGIEINQGWNSLATELAAPIVWRNNGDGLRMADYATLYATTLTGFGNNGYLAVSSGGSLIELTTPAYVQDIAAYEANQPLRTNGGRIRVFRGALRGRVLIDGPGDIVVSGATWANFLLPTFTRSLGGYAHLIIKRFNDAADDERMYYAYGPVLSNQVTRHTPSGLSWQHLPSGGAAVWFRPNIPYRAAVVSGVAVTLSAWVYVDAAYNGAAKPRIVCLGGRLQGVPNDVIGTSHSGALVWELLTVNVTPTETGMIEFVVGGQGTAGSWYCDDIGAV